MLWWLPKNQSQLSICSYQLSFYFHLSLFSPEHERNCDYNLSFYVHHFVFITCYKMITNDLFFSRSFFLFIFYCIGSVQHSRSVKVCVEMRWAIFADWTMQRNWLWMIIILIMFNDMLAFSCTDVCLGDLRPALTDEAGCWVMLLCCANHENENPDVFLWASPGDAYCPARLSAFSYSKPQRPLAHHHHTGNNLTAVLFQDVSLAG